MRLHTRGAPGSSLDLETGYPERLIALNYTIFEVFLGPSSEIVG
jgi:hypothetical protein